MPAFTTALGASILAGLGATSMTAAAATGLGIAATGAGAFGAYKGVEAIGKTMSKKPNMPGVTQQGTGLSATEAITSSEDEAKKAMELKSRMRALRGGKTLLTSETLGSSGTTAPNKLTTTSSF